MKVRGGVRPIRIQGLKWEKGSFSRNTWAQRGEEMKIHTKQEKRKQCPPVLPAPHGVCVGTAECGGSPAITKRGDERTHYLPGINWLLFYISWQLMNFRVALLRMWPVVSGWQLSPNAVMTNSESQFSYSGSPIPEDIYEHLELQLPGTGRKHHHHMTLGF